MTRARRRARRWNNGRPVLGAGSTTCRDAPHCSIAGPGGGPEVGARQAAGLGAAL